MMTIKSILAKVSEHPGEYHALYMLAALGISYGAGYWQCSRNFKGASEIENRQLAGTLTVKEREIQAANLKIGKVETDLQTSEKIKEKLSEDNAQLASTANSLARQYNLKLDQYSKLQADFNASIAGGHSGNLAPALASSLNPECGKCKGQIDFGTYASCGWSDYAALKTGGTGGLLNLKLGVQIQSVSLRQDPKNGSLRAEIGRAYLTDNAGNVIVEGQMNENSKVFTAPSLLGDMNRRHFYLYSGVSPSYGALGLYTQRGVSPFIYGLQLNRDWKTKELQPGLFIGFQLR